MMLLITCGWGSNQQDKRKDRKIDGSPSQAKNSLLRLYLSIVAGGVLSKTSFPRSLASCPLLGSYSASWVRSLGTWLQFCEAVQKSASRKSNLTASNIRRHCHGCVHAGVSQALEVVLPHRLHLGGR